MAPPDQDIRNRLLVVRLPTLPHILLKLIEYCSADRVGMAELAELVSKDTAIAAKIVSVANSSAFHRGGQKAKLEQSLMTLGTDMIRTLVISQSVHQTFSQFATSTTTNLCRFWEHSLTNAVLAREVAKKTGYHNIDEAYLCGLIHDIARLAFLVIAPGKYADLFQKDDSPELCEAEQQILQMTHSEAGAWLAGRWKLSSDLADSILFHHEPVARVEKTPVLVRIIYLAHALSCQPYNASAVQDAARLCNLTLEDLEPIRKGAMQKVAESAEFLGINLGQGADADTAKSTEKAVVQEKLATELNHVVHASETERHFARQTSEPALLRTIAQSMHILFNVDDVIIMTPDPLNQTLTVAPNVEHQQKHAGFTFDLMQGGTLAAAIAKRTPAFITRQPHPTSEDPLLKLLHANSIIGLPIVSDSNCLGVLVGKVSPIKIIELHENLSFLQVFAAQAASALISLRQKHEEMRNLTANAVDEFRLSSRKVAHEASNPLTVIRNYLHVLNDKLHKQQPVGNEITILHDEIDRVCKIIQKFVDPQPITSKETTNVNQLIDDISRMMRDSGFAAKTISINTQIDPNAALTDCDSGKLWQILLNLLKNAIEAMQNGGQITIANQGHVNQNGRLYINLLVKDTGTGIPKDILEKLFSPVTSTKGGSNRGLGLSIVQDLINELNGSITCRSSTGGTAFEILLPVRSATTKPAPSPQAA